MNFAPAASLVVFGLLVAFAGCTTPSQPKDSSSFGEAPEIAMSTPPRPYTTTPIARMTNSIRFQDTTETAGLSYSGASRGASWGDFNGDGWPDVWTSNHLQNFGLYLNQADGTFTNIITDVLSVTQGGDAHGAAWADFDNDGDQDLVQQAGAQRGVGQGPTQLYINSDGKLTEQAANFGLADPFGRGRTPLWVDWNNDGRLDVLLTNGKRPDGQAPSILYQYKDGGFQPVMEFPDTALFAQSANLSGDDDRMDLVVHGTRYPLGIFNYSHVAAGRYTDLTDTLVSERLSGVNDVVIADFNNDLHPDLFLARSTTGGTDVFQPDDNQIRARLSGGKGQKGFSFRTDEEPTFRLFAPTQLSLRVYIGSEGRRLPKDYTSQETPFTLSSHDPSVAGTAPREPDIDGVFIGYEPATQTWQVLISSRDQYQVNFAINSPGIITDLTTMGFEPIKPSNTAQLLLYDHGQFRKWTSSGFDVPDFCGASAVTGDFDNDMDMDLYLVCTRLTANLPNILYENMGSGTFVAVPGAGGAAGSLAGVGDSVSTVDFDRDGFLDLFLTNGPMRFYWGPNQLFRNQGNENHWIEIDLEGTISNRDGVGARLLATTGNVTQLREQGGGMHIWTQNHQRIHFGLGDNTTVDRLSIYWPSGVVQELTNVAADQILHLVEPYPR